MKKKIRAQIFTLIILILAMAFTNGCKDKEKIPPVLTTSAVTGITSVSATCGGSVTGGCNLITAQGVCWSTGANPTIDDSKTSDESCGESFTSAIKGLTPNTTYYVRAYASSSSGTAYGNEVSFTEP